MIKYILKDIFIYPIKSLGGFSVKNAEVTDRGFKHDRRWMLIDENYNFLTQRSIREMSLIQTEIRDNLLIAFNTTHGDKKLKNENNSDIKTLALAFLSIILSMFPFIFKVIINMQPREELKEFKRLIGLL